MIVPTETRLKREQKRRKQKIYIVSIKNFVKLTSSKLKSTPPMGAPKATDTPAAAAADNISRFFASFRPYLGNRYDRILPRNKYYLSTHIIYAQLICEMD